MIPTWVRAGSQVLLLGQRYEANTPLIPGLLNGYRTLHLDVEMAQPEGKLFWSGILFSADVPIRADWRNRPHRTCSQINRRCSRRICSSRPVPPLPIGRKPISPLSPWKNYARRPSNTPQSIQERYLKLPTSVPERVRQLAREITKDKTTAYDKAKAIEAYLRSYPYDLDVPAPPEDQDVADYFLFDLKKGYCDYYATAMVVLARASGLPARFVSGYASGSYDAANAEYIVRELHAHSWAEVYFPEIGWIEFEPTAAQPEIEIPPSEEEITNAPPDDTATRLLNRFRLETLLYWLSPLGIVILGFLLYFTWIERWLYMRLPPENAVERMYRQLYRLGRPLAGERTKAETAYEFMSKLIDRINDIREHSRHTKYLSHVEHAVEYLTDLYQDTLFAHHTIDKDDVRKALTAWNHLRLRLLLARLHVIARRALAPTKQSPDFIQKIFSPQRTSSR